jgi:hypothetical protein
MVAMAAPMRLVLGLMSVLAIACSSETTPHFNDGLPDACHPLRYPGVCASPYPAMHYMVADDTTSTGFRLALEESHFPVNASGVAFDPSPLNVRDGFSASTHLLVAFEERLATTNLPTWQDPAASVLDSSATLLIDTETGERVPHFAELDAQVTDDVERQALMIRPVARLRHGVRYVAAVRSLLTTVDGAPASGAPGWANGRDANVVAELERDGTSPDGVLLAWDFVTASDASSTRDLSTMTAATLALVPATGLGYTISRVDEDFSPTTLRRIVGTFTVPRFVDHTDLTRADIAMLRDADGAPMANGTYEAPFVFIVPRSAATTPARLAIYGHGFINTAEGAFGEADGSSFTQSFGESHGYAFIGTNWWGLSRDETQSGAIPDAVSDMNNLPWIATRLQQSVVNQVVLARTAKVIAADAAVLAGVTIDNGAVDYVGISLGGIMGSVFLGYTPDVAHAVLHVAAARWSTLLQRSKLWGLFGIFVNDAYPAALAQLQLIAALQEVFADVEGLTRADQLTDSGSVLVQMGVNDDSVTNVASMMLARTMGLSVLDDTPLAIPLLDTAAGPLKSAFTVWDTGEPPPPTTNIANPTTSTNTVHDQLRNIPALQTQMDMFLRTGDVASTCDGTCDPE